MTLLLSEGNGLTADHCSSTSSPFVCAVFSPHQTVLHCPSKALPKMASSWKSERSAAVCPLPQQRSCCWLSKEGMAEALPVPAGVSPGVVAKTSAEHLPKDWKDARPGIRERSRHTHIRSGGMEPQIVLWISSLLGALSQVSSSSERSSTV